MIIDRAEDPKSDFSRSSSVVKNKTNQSENKCLYFRDLDLDLYEETDLLLEQNELFWFEYNLDNLRTSDDDNPEPTYTTISAYKFDCNI